MQKRKELEKQSLVMNMHYEEIKSIVRGRSDILGGMKEFEANGASKKLRRSMLILN